jgi:DedD protein
VERHVKERLIGAAVLVAAAVILIPEMLSGPRHQGSDQPTQVDGQAPLKTYTIDLSKTPGTQAAAESANAVDERAPPAESSALPPAAADVQSSTAVAQETPQPDAVAADTAPSRAAATGVNSSPAVKEPVPQSSPKSTPKEAAPKVAAPKAEAPTAAPVQRAPAASVAPTSAPAPGGHPGGWAVQLGSFASQATAQHLVKDLRAKGHEAFVMPVKSGNATLYRVRVGPLPDREAAAAALQKVKSLAPGAAIVPPP